MLQGYALLPQTLTRACVSLKRPAARRLTGSSGWKLMAPMARLAGPLRDHRRGGRARFPG